MLPAENIRYEGCMTTSLIDNLMRQAKTHPMRSALVSDGFDMGWHDLADTVLRLSNVLRQMGVSSEDRVALLCPNRPAYVMCWLALANLGAVAVSINTSLVGRGLRYSIEQSKSSVILAEKALWGEKSGDLEELVADRDLIAFEDEADLIGQASETEPDDHFRGRPGDPFSIIYTSGTTGFPKGVVNSQSVFVASGRWMAEYLEITSNDRIMVFLPLFHTNPQMYAVASALETGCALIIRPKFSANNLFADARRFEATLFTYVGTVLSMLCNRQKYPNRDHSLTRCVGGGCPSEVLDTMRDRFGITAHELYGMTEVGGWVTGTRTGSARRGTCGTVRPDMDVRIADENDHDCAPGERGEILVRPAAPDVMFSGYFDNAEASWSASRNFWFHTGDAGSIDAEGVLSFHGRMREIIRRGGENISPTEIEMVLLDHPAVTDAACVGVPDKVWGEEIKVFLVADGLSGSDVLSFLEGRLAPFMMPRFVQFTATIPRTQTEKIQRDALKKDRTNEIDLAAEVSDA